MFDITIEQAYLIKALEYLEPTVGKNANGLGDNCVSIRTTGNGSVTMFTTNTIEFTELEVIVANGGTTQEQAPLVDFKRFKAIVSTIPANEIITLKASVNDMLINFGLKKTPIKLVGCTSGIIPLPNNQFPVDIVSIPKNLIRQALSNVCSVVSDSDASPIYNCMRIFTDKNTVEVTAVDVTDKRTFVHTGLAVCNNPVQEILIEASKLKKSMRLFEDFNEMEFTMDSNMIRVEASDPKAAANQKTKGMVSDIKYYCRRLSGAFPTNIKTSFYPQPKEYVEINKEELSESFMRAKAIEDQTSSGLVRIELKTGKLTIGMNTTHGAVEDDIDAVNKPATGFASVFKYPNIMDVLKTIDSDTVEIGMLPNHPSNYIIRSTGQDKVMFTVSTMNNAAASRGTP